MSDIKRYMPLLYDYGMEDQNDGEYVKYADYKAAIEQLQARIAELEEEIKRLRAPLKISDMAEGETREVVFKVVNKGRIPPLIYDFDDE